MNFETMSMTVDARIGMRALGMRALGMRAPGMRAPGIECRIGSLYSVFTPFFPFRTISVKVDFHFFCFTFVSIVDWMMQV